jgi:hypothetical protein
MADARGHPSSKPKSKIDKREKIELNFKPGSLDARFIHWNETQENIFSVYTERVIGSINLLEINDESL